MPIVEIRDNGTGWPQSSAPPRPQLSRKQREAITEAEALVARAQRAHDALQAAAADDERRRLGGATGAGFRKTRGSSFVVVVDGTRPELEHARRTYVRASAFRWELIRQARADQVNDVHRRLPSPPAGLLRALEAAEHEAGITPRAS